MKRSMYARGGLVAAFRPYAGWTEGRINAEMVRMERLAAEAEAGAREAIEARMRALSEEWSRRSPRAA